MKFVNAALVFESGFTGISISSSWGSVFSFGFMAMFDWNDEELTNIIWDEARETDDDHIVPYPDQNEEKIPVLFGDPTKKEMNHEISYVSPIEQKKPCLHTEHRAEVVGSCKYGVHDPLTGFSNSCPDGFDTARIKFEKVNQDSRGTAACNSVMNAQNGFLDDETGQIDKVSDFFQNPTEDAEQGEFVDYGWANVGSFDDLDRMFRNNNSICGDTIGGTVDEPWLSSQGVASGTSMLTPASCDSSDLPLGPQDSLDGAEVGAEFLQDPTQSFVSIHEIFSDIKSHARKDEQIGGNIKACQKKPGGGKTARVKELPEKGNHKKGLLGGRKCQKSEENNLIRQVHDLGSVCSSQASCPQQFSYYAQAMANHYPSLLLRQQRQFQGAVPFEDKQFSGPSLSSTFYGDEFHYPTTSILPTQLGNANSSNKPADSTVKPPTMTPKEKIEKLRKRQQLRAILAIQKQQQQFNNHISVEHSTMERKNSEVDENLITIPSLYRSTSTEVDDSCTVSIPSDNLSVEESVLYQLQEAISKLDIQIRLCIRDSLFRLAQSSKQRQCPSDTFSVNSRDKGLSNKDIDTHKRFSRILNEETDTNPIDRIVANLLFHRPLELSGNLAEKHDSPASSNLSCERSLDKGHFLGSFEKARVTSPHGSETPHVCFDKDQSRNVLCSDTFQNSSNSEAADSGVTGY